MISAFAVPKRAWRLLARVFPRCSMIAQAIAFNLFLAFFPTLLIAVGELLISRAGHIVALIAVVGHRMGRLLLLRRSLLLPPLRAILRMTALLAILKGGEQ